MNTTLLINILTKSVEKNGADYVLTLGHLLNIIKLVDKIEDKQASWDDIYPFDPNWDQSINASFYRGYEDFLC